MQIIMRLNIFFIPVFFLGFFHNSLGLPDQLYKSKSSKMISEVKLNDTKDNEKIAVISFNKKYDSSSTFWEDYSSRCLRWNLSKENIIKIIKNRRKIDKFEFSYFYEVLPCTYQGYVLIGNKKYHFEINSGSFIILERMGKYVYYGCSNKYTRKYFMLPPATKKDM